VKWVALALYYDCKAQTLRNKVDEVINLGKAMMPVEELMNLSWGGM